MTKAIRYDKTGGPEVMKWVDVDVGEPGEGEVRLRQGACGLNYIDVYFRTGLYPQPLPAGLGMEAAGEVTAVGRGVSTLKVGDRVAYVARPPGAYAQERVLRADQVIKLPDSISDEAAASIMLQGLTAQYLLRRTYRVKAGDTILIQAAAGGVGLLVCQWAKALGATVIGTVGSDEKAAIAKAHGCDHPIVYTREDFTARVREITHGAGVPVVYDSIGKDTYVKSLDCLSPLGMFVSFGNSSGPLPPIDSSEFAGRGLDQDRIARFHAVRAAQQVLRGEPLEHDRRAVLVADRIGQTDQLVGAHHALLRIGAARPPGVGDALAHLQARHARPHRLHDAGRLHAEPGGQRLRIKTGAEIDVDIVQPAGGLFEQHLALARLAHFDVHPLHDLGAAGLVDPDCLAHHVSWKNA